MNDMTFYQSLLAYKSKLEKELHRIDKLLTENKKARIAENALRRYYKYKQDPIKYKNILEKQKEWKRKNRKSRAAK